MAFFSFDSLGGFFDYVKNIVGVTKTVEQGTTWADGLKANSKIAKFVNNTAATGTYGASESIQVGQGKQFTVIDGGAKSAPTVESIFTDSTTHTADINSDAVGSITNGISAKTPIINVVSGIMAALGLLHIGIQISNLPFWKEMASTVFGKEFTADEKIDAVKEFFMQNYTMLVSKYESATTPSASVVASYIPQNIIDSMYNFLCNYTMENPDSAFGVEPFIPESDNASFWYFSPSFEHIFFQEFGLRYETCRKPASGPLGEENPYSHWRHVDMPMVSRISDSLIQQSIKAFIEQMIGGGFNVSESTASILLSGAVGFCQYIRENNPHIWDTYINTSTYIRVECSLNRSQGVPKSTPVSAAEVALNIICYNWDYINSIARDYTGYDPSLIGNKIVSLYFSPTVNFMDVAPYIMLLLGKTGGSGVYDTDFAYRCTTRWEGGEHTTPDSCNATSVQLTFSGNVPHIYIGSTVYGQVDGEAYGGVFVNGFIDPQYMDEITGSTEAAYPKATGFTAIYSNIGMIGSSDDYILNEDGEAAGLFKSSKQSKLPAGSTSITNRYSGYTDSTKNKQIAQTDGLGNRQITTYIPTVVPAGTTQAEKSLEHGYAGAVNPDPAAIQALQNQAAIQSGELPANFPISDINDAINKMIQEYNDSRRIVDNIPDPYPVPETDPVPEYPTEPTSEPEGDTGDTPVPATMETVTASGLVSVYNPTKAQLVSFSGWLWSSNFLDNFLKLFQNPMDAIIGLHILYATPSTGTASNIIAGYLDSGVSAKVVNNQFTDIDCGTVTVPEYYGSAIDYEPYVQVHCYLPFVGMVSLKPNDIIGKKVNIKYGVDALTGTCLALITTKKDDAEITCYHFSGNCATQVPISGGSYAQMITGLASMAVGIGASVMTGNPIGIAGAALGMMNSHFDVAHSGAVSANAGAMDIRKPYLIITRKKAYNAVQYNHYYGFPANKTVTLGSCSGYTRVKSVHIDSIYNATDNEKAEIEALLKQGVIIK